MFFLGRVLLTPFLCLIVAVTACTPTQTSTSVAFSPSGHAIDVVLNTIAKAEATIEVAAYSFSSEKIAAALMNAHDRNVQVRVVLDKTNAARDYKAVHRMRNAGIAIRINHRYAIMHNKYIIIDSKTIQTGSFNYSLSAEERNAENVVVIENNPSLAKRYLGNWEKLWNESKR